MAAQLDDPARPARSITLHYLRPPAAGPLRIDVVVERSGRTLSTLSARLTQEDRLCVIADRGVRGRLPRGGGRQVQRADAGRPAGGGGRACSRPTRPRRRSATGSSCATPSGPSRSAAARRRSRAAGSPCTSRSRWMPRRSRSTRTRGCRPSSAGSRCRSPRRRSTSRSTSAIPSAAARVAADEPILGVFRSDYAADGLAESDGELWSPDGVLLAHSRQLMLLLPWTPS